MASGYFPLNSYDGKRYELLKGAVDNLKEALETLTYDDSQFDNAASDGGYLAELYLAKKLIEGSIGL
jgi:hypothetical protein